MPFLPSSGALSINDIRNLFGGPGSPSMANYYRGGAYIPATKTVNYTAREPASGWYLSYSNPLYLWTNDKNNDTGIYWANSLVFNQYGQYGSVTVGGYTYYPQTPVSNSTTGVARTFPSSYQQAINTGIPSSGQIAMSQFYGAEKP